MIKLGVASPGVTDNNTVSNQVNTDCMAPRSRGDGRAADKAQLHRLKKLRQAHFQAASRSSDVTPLRTVLLAGPEWRSCPGWLFLSDSHSLSLHEIRSHQVDKRMKIARAAVAEYSKALHTHQTRARKRLLQQKHQPSAAAYEHWPLPQHIPLLPTADSASQVRAEWHLWAAGTCGPVGAATWTKKVKSNPAKLSTVTSRTEGRILATMLEELVYMIEATVNGVFPLSTDNEPLTIVNWVPYTYRVHWPCGVQSWVWWQARRAAITAGRESYVAYIALHSRLMNPLKLDSDCSVPLAPNTWVESLNDQHADRLANLGTETLLPHGHQRVPACGKSFMVTINGGAVTVKLLGQLKNYGSTLWISGSTSPAAASAAVLDARGLRQGLHEWQVRGAAGLPPRQQLGRVLRLLRRAAGVRGLDLCMLYFYDCS